MFACTAIYLNVCYVCLSRKFCTQGRQVLENGNFICEPEQGNKMQAQQWQARKE